MPETFLVLIHNLLGKFAISISLLGVLAVDFSNQITLSGVITTAIVIIIAGIFTIRSKIAANWHEAYAAEKTLKEQIEKELAEQQVSRLEFEKQQQELRHTLKSDIAARDLQLQALQAKTDLTTALKAIEAIALAQATGTAQTHSLLTEIRDGLAKR